MAGDGQDWRNALFRKKVMAQIDVAVREAGNPTSKSSSEMENHVFQKAKSREEYLALVARLILHVKDFNNQEKKKAQMAAVAGQLPPGQAPQMPPGQLMGMATNMVGAQGLADSQREKAMQIAAAAGQLPPGQPQQMMPGQPMGMSSNMVGTQGHPGLIPGPPQANPGMMQDPINALQKMARHTGPGGIPQQQQPGQPPQMGSGMVGMVPPQQQLQQQKVQQIMQQQLMQQRLAQRQMQQQQQAQQYQIQQQQQQQVPTLQRQDAFIVTSPQQMTQQMSQAQMSFGPVMSTAQSPGQIQMNMGQQPQPGSAPSPSGMAASPITILMSPSPGPGPGQSPVSRAIQQVGAPSPGAPLNTPAGNPPSVPSPASRNPTEDQAYLDKLKQLSKYIEPLRRMINKAEKDDKKKDQLSKMKNLLEILSDSNRRLPMATLLKCEQVLEKLNLYPGGASTPSTGPAGSGMISSTPRPADQHMALCQPLLDAVAGCLGSPLLNHTLQRTFGPAMMALNGPPISVPNLPIKRKACDDSPESEISDILQGEIARLDSRFKVSLDPVYHPLSNTVHLFCKLDDKNLPNVPPILITVPQNYPRCSPRCDTSTEDYEATPFLQTIKQALSTQLLRMPDKVSVTSLLNTWEMSVRKACSPAVM